MHCSSKQKSNTARFSEEIQKEGQNDPDYGQDIIPKACGIARDFITKDMRKFLDVGCGPGYFGKMIKDMQEAYVVGIEFTKKVTEHARKRLDEVHEVDAEYFDLPYEKQYFDCIAYFDVLEHMIDPWRLLKKHRPFLRNDGAVIASIPNIRNLGTLSEVINDGRWSYRKEGGILDATHLRFFTWLTINELFQEAGYKIVATGVTTISLYTKWLELGKPKVIDLGTMNIRLDEDGPVDFFVAQFVIKAEKTTPD